MLFSSSFGIHYDVFVFVLACLAVNMWAKPSTTEDCVFEAEVAETARLLVAELDDLNLQTSHCARRKLILSCPLTWSNTL